MSDLAAFRDYTRRMSTATHRDDCARSCNCGKSWCCGCAQHPPGKPWGWAYLRWQEHDIGCYPTRCAGCVTDSDRALWTRLADEADAFLAREIDPDLFGASA